MPKLYILRGIPCSGKSTWAENYARDMARIYCPAKAFVLDICLYQDEYKIVEINCINCSGFYDADMSKLIQALENTFS